MFSQPSEISDFRLRHEVIITCTQAKATKQLHRLHHLKACAKFPVSMFSQPSEISDFRLRREVIITCAQAKTTQQLHRLHHLKACAKFPVSMFSQPSEISDFRLRREVIITQSAAWYNVSVIKRKIPSEWLFYISKHAKGQKKLISMGRNPYKFQPDSKTFH